jgi:predicted acetyltransferase
VTIELRPITPDELDAFRRVDQAGFGYRPDPDDPHDHWAGLELERARAACDGDEIVGCGRNYSLELTLPGAVPMAAGGVSWISVLPTHRRQGILRSLMTRLLDDSVERGESVSVLTASEGGIYRRFGYGIAARTLGVQLARREVEFASPPPPGRLRMVEADEGGKLFPALFDRARCSRPGAVSRPGAWWADEYVMKEQRPRFDVVFEDADGAHGFATYHIQGGWSEGEARKTLGIRDLVTATPAAEAALWQYLCGVDLIEQIQWWNCPLDSALPWMLTDPRAVRPTSLRDFLWARVLDAPVALAARQYRADGRLVLEVADRFRPEGAAAGRFVLETSSDGAACTRTDAAPDLALDVADLGAVYLGDVRPSTLARAGRITEHDSGALERADAMFAAERAPFAMTWF